MDYWLNTSIPLKIKFSESEARGKSFVLRVVVQKQNLKTCGYS